MHVTRHTTPGVGLDDENGNHKANGTNPSVACADARRDTERERRRQTSSVASRADRRGKLGSRGHDEWCCAFRLLLLTFLFNDGGGAGQLGGGRVMERSFEFISTGTSKPVS